MRASESLAAGCADEVLTWRLIMAAIENVEAERRDSEAPD
jgi:hypothetical protein